VVLAGAANHGGWAPVLRFALATCALAGLAWAVSLATEQLGERTGPGVTGMLQSTLGNLPELFVVIFALKAGQLVVAQTAIVGSILANALLVLGLVIVVGARRSDDGVMRFSKRLPRDTATLLLSAVFIIVLLGLSLATHDPASHHVEAISTVGAICVLVVYVAWLIPYLRSDAAAHGGTAVARGALALGSPHDPTRAPSPDAAPDPSPDAAPDPLPDPPPGPLPDPAPGARPGPRLSLRSTLSLLVLAGAGSAFVSEWFVNALAPAIGVLHLSQAFAGLVIVAIAGNAVENVVGVALAYRRRFELAISVVKNSVAQVAAFLFPVLVLVSLALSTRLTFALAPVYIGALTLTAIAVWQVTGDGEAAEFEGWGLVALYVIMATLTLYE
jgi:Ca2+:H+ antiporter